MNVKGLFASWAYITFFEPMYFSEQKGNLYVHMVLVSNLGLGFILSLATKPKKAPLKNCQKLTIMKLEGKMLTQLRSFWLATW